MEWIVLLVPLFALVFSGVFVFVAVGVTSFIVYYFLAGEAQSMMGAAFWSSIQMYALVAVGCFILMGQIIMKSGISQKVYNSLAPIMERVPGGLLHTNIAICALFASIFGASAATTAVVGSSAFPELKKRNYHFGLTMGTVAAGGTLGIMIPPSAAFIIYGALTETSVGALFAAGILPGILLAILFSIYVAIKCIQHPEYAPRSETVEPIIPSLKYLIGIWPIVVLIAVVLIPILAGWSTATEASGIGVIGSILVGMLYGDLTLKDIVASVRESTHTFCMLLLVVCGAMLLAKSAALIGLPRALSLYIGGLNVSPTVVMLGLIVMYLALGCLFDGISFMVMTLPFVYPIITKFGFGGIWFAVVLVVLIEIGQLTPPVGLNLYVIQAITDSDEVSLEDIVRGVWPFFWILVAFVAVLICFPQIATFLPQLFGFEIQ
ncbi:MAG: TRAP transporter large permease [bacterium]